MHDFFNFLSFVVFAGVVAGLVIYPKYLRSRDRDRMHQTLRMAYERGQPVPPELIAALQTDPVPQVSTRSSDRDLRRAIVLIGLGLGFALLGLGLWYGLMSVDDTAAYITGGSTAGFGAIPGLIGVAYLVLWLLRRDAPTNPPKA